MSKSKEVRVAPVVANNGQKVFLVEFVGSQRKLCSRRDGRLWPIQSTTEAQARELATKKGLVIV